MYRLEYRDAGSGQLLYAYNHIRGDELAVRNVCDFFIKDRQVYEKVTIHKRNYDHTIYIQPYDEPAQPEHYYETLPFIDKPFVVELREYRDNAEFYPVKHLFGLDHYLDVLALLQSDRIEVDGEQWEKTSAELDEDRKMYAVYGTQIR